MAVDARDVTIGAGDWNTLVCFVLLIGYYWLLLVIKCASLQCLLSLNSFLPRSSYSEALSRWTRSVAFATAST